MNLKIVLPWVCALGLGVGFAATFMSGRAKDSELANLRQESGQLQQARSEVEDAQSQVKALQEQIAELKKDREELLRLRGEVSQLRGEKQQLSKQVQLAMAEADRAQALATRTSQASERQMQQLQAQNQQLQAIQGEQLARRDACINNLRMIDAAKQQWALENNKTADAVPTAADITPYFKNNAMPGCPAGGVYSVNALTNLPTCSIPGHALR